MKCSLVIDTQLGANKLCPSNTSTSKTSALSPMRSPKSPVRSRRVHFRVQAETLLQQCPPTLLALDLDHTLWPENCYESATGPFIPCSHINNRTVGCIDPKTKDGRIFSLFSEAREILEFLRQRGVPLTICSRSPDKSISQGILQSLNLWDCFILPQIYRQRKTYHFRNLNDCLDIPYKQILFFDDCEANISAVSGLGVISSKVNPKLGLTWESLVHGLQKYKENILPKVDSVEEVMTNDALGAAEVADSGCDSPVLSASPPSVCARFSLSADELDKSVSPSPKWRFSPVAVAQHKVKKQVRFNAVPVIINYSLAEIATDDELSTSDDSIEEEADALQSNNFAGRPLNSPRKQMQNLHALPPHQSNMTSSCSAPTSSGLLHVLSLAAVAKLQEQGIEDNSSLLGKRKLSASNFAAPSAKERHIFPESLDSRDVR